MTTKTQNVRIYPDVARPFYAIGPYVVFSDIYTLIDFGTFAEDSLSNIVISVQNDIIQAQGLTQAEFAAFLISLIEEQGGNDDGENEFITVTIPSLETGSADYIVLGNSNTFKWIITAKNSTATEVNSREVFANVDSTNNISFTQTNLIGISLMIAIDLVILDGGLYLNIQNNTLETLYDIVRISTGTQVPALPPNPSTGITTLSGGTVTVNTTKVTATSRIFLGIQSLGTVIVPTTVGVTARTASISFTITSADGTDTSVIAWQIIEPV
jgi:hypothetical protein